MSHSRIIQVSRNIVNETERVKANDLDIDMLQREIEYLDYIVDSDETREDDLLWLKKGLEKIGFSLEGDKVITGTDTQFLSRWKEEAIKAAESLDLWKMQSIANGSNFSAFYILDEAYGYPISLWHWAKEVVNSGEEYFVGGIIDYHF